MAKHRLTTFENARTYEGEDGRTFANSEDALELAIQIAHRDRDLLDRLVDQ